MAAVALALLPFMLFALVLGVVVAILTLSVALLVPLLPVAFLAFCLWAAIKAASRPARSAI